MATLHETLSASEPARRKVMLDDCVRLIDSEVSAKSGMSGLAVKAGFKVVKAVKPGFIREVIDMLFDDFVAEVEPFWTSRPEDTDFGDYLIGRKREVASALLGVTDKRAARAKTRSVKKAYNKLRPRAQNHVEDAVPGMARILARHAAG